jgi:hypothetical protein
LVRAKRGLVFPYFPLFCWNENTLLSAAFPGKFTNTERNTALHYRAD